MSYYTNVWASEVPDIAPMSEVNKLRSDTQVIVSELASSANDSFLLKEDFNIYNRDLQKKLYTLNRDNKNIINQLSNLTKIFSFNPIKDVLLRSKELYKRHADKKRLEPPVFKEEDLEWVQTLLHSISKIILNYHLVSTDFIKYLKLYK